MGARLPSDPGLTLRMVLAAVVTPLLVLAAVGALVLVAPWRIVAGVALATAIGIGVAVRERKSAAHGREVTPEQAPELHAVVERLCVVADLPKPRIVVESEPLPNSWIVSLGRGASRLHVSTGLLERLDAHELEAVIGHELAHVAHRDAAVMTVVGGPGAVMLAGGGTVARTWSPIMLGGVAALATGWLASVGTRALSRYREFAADAGSAALTGNPAALASALVKVSDGIVAVPRDDLRVVAARDPFHLLPVTRPSSWLAKSLPSTHPSLKARIARLERLEAALQARPPR